MTSGERMVFSVAFNDGIGKFYRPDQAAVEARRMVEALRMASDGDIDDDTRAMLTDMLGVRT